MFDPKIPYNHLPLLPGDFEYDQKVFLKLAIKASEEISRLNGLVHLIPNHEILISPLLIKESVESSAIENINTTTLKVLQSHALPASSVKWPEKEVLYYHRAILAGYERLKRDWGIGYNALLDIQSLVEPGKPWVRKLPGTVIANSHREVLYTPPVGEDVIVGLLSNLERWMHTTEDDIDPLIKMPVIHYQFESIHPFYDGNGRTGRILNVLYLVMAGKLDFPILFLSEYINKTRSEYYRLFNKTRNEWNYDEFIIYLLDGIIIQSQATSNKIMKIHTLIREVEGQISLLNMDYHKITTILFSKPFLTVSDFTEIMGVTRQSASKYIKILEENNILSSLKVGKNKLLYVQSFIDILT
jgi:Fic family protein